MVGKQGLMSPPPLRDDSSVSQTEELEPAGKLFYVGRYQRKVN